MNVTFPEIRIGKPLRYDGLSVFPLFAEPCDDVEYVLSDEAIQGGSVAVEEISESGSVPELSVENKGDVRVLFLEGEELIGAKQNRILNTSVLIAAHTKTKLPVSCVEAGRWGYKSRKFGSGGTCSPSRLRGVLKRSVGQALKAKRGHRSDQGQVWEEVGRQQAALCCYSATSAMSDTFETYRKRLGEFQEKLQYEEGAIGAAVAIGGKVVACDLFDKPSTCRKVWNRLLTGFVLDALEGGEQEKQVGVPEAEMLLAELDDLSWQSVNPVGEGEESRAESKTGDQASALTLDGTLVHGSLVTAW